MAEPSETTVVMNVSNCARCGKDHDNLEFDKLTAPIASDDGSEPWNYWAICPISGEPVLMRVIPITG